MPTTAEGHPLGLPGKGVGGGWGTKSQAIRYKLQRVKEKEARNSQVRKEVVRAARERIRWGSGEGRERRKRWGVENRRQARRDLGTPGAE